MTRTLSLAALALVCLAAPALAAEAAANSTVTLVSADGIVAALQAAIPMAATALTTLVGVVITKFFPLARLFITDRVVEQALEKWMSFGINAVAGAARGKELSVDVGSAVLAQALNRALDRAELSKQGKALLEKAGGPAEVAAKLFRMLNLDETGSDAILQRVIADLRAAGQIKG